MKPDKLDSNSNPTYRSAIPDGAGGAAAESALTSAEAAGSSSSSQSLAQSMLNAVCDLLFCPEFTVAPNKASAARHGYCSRNIFGHSKIGALTKSTNYHYCT